MSHKAKDMIRLEEYCRAAGLTKKYCKLLGELSLRYYHFSWLPSLLMDSSPDTLIPLRDSLFRLGDRNRTYKEEELNRSIRLISRLDLFDILVDRAIECVWDEILTDPDDSYMQILRYCYLDHTNEPEYDFYLRTGLSKSTMYEKRGNLLIAVGLAMNGCAVPLALDALGEWG